VKPAAWAGVGVGLALLVHPLAFPVGQHVLAGLDRAAAPRAGLSFLGNGLADCHSKGKQEKGEGEH
jgi:hypothetical protein